MAGASFANYWKDRFRFKGVAGSKVAYGICSKFVIKIDGLFSLKPGMPIMKCRFVLLRLRGVFVQFFLLYMAGVWLNTGTRKL